MLGANLKSNLLFLSEAAFEIDYSFCQIIRTLAKLFAFCDFSPKCSIKRHAKCRTARGQTKQPTGRNNKAAQIVRVIIEIIAP